MIIERDGARLAYEEAGTGEPAVVLIHGWGTDRTSLARPFELLSATQRVVSVDLRGFGESSAPAQAYTIDGYAEDVALVAEQLGLRRFVVIGHSMGGLVALALAARHPERVAGVVVLEAFVAASDQARAPLHGMLEALRAESGRDFAVRLMTHLLGPSLAPDERERMLAIVPSIPQHILVSAFEAMLAFDSRGAAARVRSPVLYVGTGAPYADEDEFLRLCPQLVTERLSDCGHYFPLEAPEKLNALLARFVRVCAG